MADGDGRFLSIDHYPDGWTHIWETDEDFHTLGELPFDHPDWECAEPFTIWLDELHDLARDRFREQGWIDGGGDGAAVAEQRPTEGVPEP